MRNFRSFITSKWTLFGIILIFASIFRLILIQYVEFKGDEALNLFLATRPIFHHPFPAASETSSAGILNFPLLNYLLFPIVIFTQYPPAISLTIAIINVLTIGGYFLLFEKYHGKLTAFFAVSLISFAPWAILYSRKIWAQDFLLPLSLPFLLSIYKICEGKKKFWLLFGVSSMLLAQIHQLAILFPLTFFVGLFVFGYRPSWKFLLSGLALGIIPTIAYILYLPFAYCSNCSTTIFTRLSFHTFITFLRPLQILSIGDFYIVMGDNFAVFAQRFHIAYIVSKFTYIEYVLVPIGTMLFWMKKPVYRFFVTSCAVILFLYFVLGVEPLMHYFILFIPFLSLFLASFFVWTVQNAKLKIIGIISFIILLISLVLYDSGFFSLLSEKKGFSGDYGTGFETSLKGSQKQLSTFKNYANYKEIQVAYFVPIEFFHGYMPIGKMIFPTDSLQKDQEIILTEFTHHPTNPLARLEMFAYFTQNFHPSWDYVLFLRSKAKKYPEYDFIYRMVVGDYLTAHLKHLYESPDFVLLYPQHWKLLNDNDQTILTDDVVKIIINKYHEEIPNTIFLTSHYYSFVLNSDSTYAKKVYQEVLSSIRAAN